MTQRVKCPITEILEVFWAETDFGPVQLTVWRASGMPALGAETDPECQYAVLSRDEFLGPQGVKALRIGAKSLP